MLLLLLYKSKIMGCDSISHIDHTSQFPLKFRNRFVEGCLSKKCRINISGIFMKWVIVSPELSFEVDTVKNSASSPDNLVTGGKKILLLCEEHSCLAVCLVLNTVIAAAWVSRPYFYVAVQKE